VAVHRQLFVLLLLTLGTLACGDAGSAGADADTGTFQAALLTAGPVSDAGWYAGAYEGLLLIRDSLGAEVSHQQTRTPSEFDEAFLSFAGAGYDLLFAHGFEYQDAALRAGEQFPRAYFVVSGGSRATENVIPLAFQLSEASYLAGMLAGGMTETGILGMVGGVAIPPAAGTFRAFEAGARAVRPDVRVLETFIGNWDDVAAAQEATVAHLRRGADVVIHNTDAASFGAFRAVQEAADAGDRVFVMGMNRDQNQVAPEVTLGSAAIDIPAAFLTVAERYRAGTLGGEPVYAGARQSVVDLVVNPVLRDRILERDLVARFNEGGWDFFSQLLGTLDGTAGKREPIEASDDDPAVGSEKPRGRFEHAGRDRTDVVVGWVAQHEIERAGCGAEALQEPSDRFRPDSILPRARAQRIGVLPDDGRRRAMLLDEQHLGGAARQRLQAERAGARAEVGDRRAHDPIGQPGEERLADAVRGRPSAGATGRAETPSTPLPANDPHGLTPREEGAAP